MLKLVILHAVWKLECTGFYSEISHALLALTNPEIEHSHTSFGAQDKNTSVSYYHLHSLCCWCECSSQVFCSIIFVYFDYSASGW